MAHALKCADSIVSGEYFGQGAVKDGSVKFTHNDSFDDSLTDANRANGVQYKGAYSVTYVSQGNSTSAWEDHKATLLVMVVNGTAQYVDGAEGLWCTNNG